jgi:uncharacterized protein with HEPN domain
MTIEEMKLLTDILTSIQGIDEHLEGRRVFKEYKANKTKRRAVERELEIIGEAVNNLLKINPAMPISYSRLVVDLRNRIIHAYDNVNNTVIWKIIMKDIPVLQEEVQQLLKGK